MYHYVFGWPAPYEAPSIPKLLGVAGGAVLVGLLNDTGVVAWALMTVSGLLVWLDMLLEDHLAGRNAAEAT